MLVFHAGYYGQRLHLWAEEDVELTGPRKASRGRKPEVPTPRPHPYDPGASTLEAAAKRAGIRPGAEESSVEVCWLPTKGDEPLPSSPMVGEPPPNRARVRLAPWNVTTLALSWESSLDLLCRGRGQRTLGAGLVIGDDLAFWSSAVRMAGSLVARQKFLPGLVSGKEGFLARWQPVLTGADGHRMAELARCMPAAARSFAEPGEPAPSKPAREALEDAVTHVVDWLVRSSGKLRSPRPAGQMESMHDAWFHALRCTEPRVRWDEEALADLSRRLDEWRQPISTALTSPLRLCFRLEEPETEHEPGDEAIKLFQDGWRVRFLLQPHGDPSLHVPLEEVWKEDGPAASVLDRFGRAREFALGALGQAASLCSFVASSLESSEPTGVLLDATDAYRFLSEDAQVLRQAGFGVFLPRWWAAGTTRARLKARATASSPDERGTGRLGLNSAVEFRWDLALAGMSLNHEHLQALAELKTPLIRVRGQWVEVDAAQIRRAIRFWENNRSRTGTVKDLMEMSVGARNPVDDIEVEEVEAEGRLRELLGTLRGQEEFGELPVPDGLKCELRPYQVRGYSWLRFLRRWGLGGCLADDMGLGKTVQTLALVLHDWQQGCQRPVLVVCPTSVVSNWKREAKRFTPELPVIVHHGTDREKGEAFRTEARRRALVVSSYGLLHRDIDFLKEIPWAGVVLDEAQNIKNPETKRARAARSLEADYRLALTGTPVQNHVGDLWSIMEFLNPGLLGRRSEFKRRFFFPIQSGTDPRAADRLRRITRPFILRREKTDRSIISDLPEKMEMKVYCSLTQEQASLYTAVLGEMEESLERAGGIQRKGKVLGALSKLKQICNHPAQFLSDNSSIPGRSGKLARLTEMLEEVIDVGDQALVFTQFREMGGLLKKHLQGTFGREVLFLHGGVPQKRRARMLNRFQGSDHDTPVFILSLRAAGTGLNLTAANHVFHYDRWWNPAVEDQATDRVFRIGQERNVEVHKFICGGTVEERIDEMIERKKEVADEVVGSGESWLTNLSNDRLREVFMLGADAVGDW
mgnify:CR=1 FL=1